ncbi:MAG: hypothetical protein WAX66_00900 [Patescibacteria group bacterium]
MKYVQRLLMHMFIMISMIVICSGLSYADSSSVAPLGYKPEKGEFTPFQSIVSQEGTPDILLIQTAIPWASYADTTVLDVLKRSYRVIDMSEVATTNIDDYQVILIVNDQVQGFYDNYAANYTIFENYVKNGGTLVFFACDHGWAGGNNYTNLPGNVQVGDRISSTNIIANSNHEIVTQVLTDRADSPLTNSDMYGSYCSHNYFVESTLPAGANIIFRTDDSDKFPTFAVYPLGNGNVVASGQTWEYTYDRYTAPGVQHGFGRALPDVFKYAFSLAGGHKAAGINVDIYPEDNWLAQRPTLYKSQGDLIDIVANITNNTNPDADQSNVTLTLNIDSALVDSGPDFLHVYQRASAEEIATKDPTEITNYTDVTNGTIRTITLNGLSIPKNAVQKWNQFVFRFKLRDTLAAGKVIDAQAQVSGNDIQTSSKKLSDGGDVKVVSNGKIVITNRELMYKQYANKIDQINELWKSLYAMADDRLAVIYHVDKYDRDNDGDRTNNITVAWGEDRNRLGNGAAGQTYGYDGDPKTGKEESTINQVSIKIKGILHAFISRSGGVGSGRHVAILGGDAIIPFYRKFDPSNTVIKYFSHHNATNITQTDAQNNYLFTDIIYRDYDDKGWENGFIEDIFVGRIAGVDPDSMRKLLLSSDKDTSISDKAIKLENNARNGELTVFENQCLTSGYTVIKDIEGVSIDVPYILNGVEINYPECGVSKNHDSARWNSDFKKLFTTKVKNVPDFDLMRYMCHGNVQGIQDSQGTEYFNGSNITAENKNITTHFSDFSPFFIFDACLVGIVDGFDTTGLFNSMLPLNIRGVIGASGVTWTPLISDFNDIFSDRLLITQNAGNSLCSADKSFPKQSDKEKYTIYQMNLFGLPWARLSLPNVVNLLAYAKAPVTFSKIQSILQGTSTKTLALDSSNYKIEKSDNFDYVKVDGFDLLLKDVNTPVIPTSRFSVNIPLNATVAGVNVTFANEKDLGILNIPAYKPVPPMPGITNDGGYVVCPNIGLYPAEQYSFRVIEINGYQQVIVEVLPMLFNSATHQTSLYRSAIIQVSYTTPNQGLVQNFTSDRRTYSVSENISTTTTIENTTANNSQFSVTVQLQDLSGAVVTSKTTSQTIGSNSIGLIGVNFAAPVQSGPYNLVMQATDGINAIGQSMQDISVIDGKIVSFIAPDSIKKGSYGTFSMEFQNLSGSQVNAFEKIYIYDAGGNEIAKLPEIVEIISSGETKKTTTQWFPPASLNSGSYKAYLVVSVNGVVFMQFSESFLVTGVNDIALTNPGWNLISLRQQPSDTAISNVLGGISGKYLSAWAFQNGSWQIYDPINPGFSDLSNLEAGWGYWLNMTQPAILSVTGTEPPLTIDLIAGWNLVGYNSSTEKVITDALGSIAGEVITVWAYRNGVWQFFDPANPGFSDLTTMAPGYGYWINTNAACTWTLP